MVPSSLFLVARLPPVPAPTRGPCGTCPSRMGRVASWAGHASEKPEIVMMCLLRSGWFCVGFFLSSLFLLVRILSLLVRLSYGFARACRRSRAVCFRLRALLLSRFSFLFPFRAVFCFSARVAVLPVRYTLWLLAVLSSLLPVLPLLRVFCRYLVSLLLSS